MNRRDFLKTTGCVAGTLLAQEAAFAAAKGKRAQGKPNIIYILADDLGYGDLSCYGQKKFKTPNIDRLAAEGMKFTTHYAGFTVCAPSRCCLMTGLHTGHAQITANKEVQPEGQWPLKKGTVTIPLLLKKLGYATGMFGKWGLGPPGSVSDPTVHFDEFYGYNCQRQAHTYYPGHLWHNKEKMPLDGKTYSPDLIGKATLAFIRANKERPFFCYMPSTIPHAAMHAPKDLHDKYRKKFPEFEKRIGRYRGPQVQNPVAAFPAMVEVLDNHVGQVMKLLKELGIDDNTLVMFTSDNGPHLEGGHDPKFWDSNGPFSGFKRDFRDGGIRVPLIAHWPGKIKPGTVSNHISAFWDMMPTFMDVAGSKAPGKIDGISMLPTLLGQDANQKQHKYLFWKSDWLMTIRAGKWKAFTVRKKDGLRLHDVEKDIAEKNDIGADNPEVVAMIKKMMAEAVKPL